MNKEGKLSSETIRRLRSRHNPSAHEDSPEDSLRNPDPQGYSVDESAPDVTWQVDIPFQAIQYMPPNVRALWEDEEDGVLSVPGVGGIAVGKAEKKTDVPSERMPDVPAEHPVNTASAVDLDKVLTVPADERADDEDDMIPEPEEQLPEGPPEYDDNMVYTAGHSELAKHREEYIRYYLANRFAGFKNYQVLEMLLHFAFPQRNTAMLAESLMERFGSLHGVLGAGVGLLETVKGMTRQSAVLLDMVMQTAQRAVEEQNRSNDLLNTDQKVGEYLLRKFYGLTNETIFLLCLDNNCRLVSCTQLAQGSSSTARVSVRQICETAIISNSPNVILAHNHPGGRAYPSSEDIRTTSRLQGLLKMVDIDLVDHFIVAGDEWKSMAQMGELAVTRVTDRSAER